MLSVLLRQPRRIAPRNVKSALIGVYHRPDRRRAPALLRHPSHVTCGVTCDRYTGDSSESHGVVHDGTVKRSLGGDETVLVADVPNVLTSAIAGNVLENPRMGHGIGVGLLGPRR